MKLGTVPSALKSSSPNRRSNTTRKTIARYYYSWYLSSSSLHGISVSFCCIYAPARLMCPFRSCCLLTGRGVRELEVVESAGEKLASNRVWRVGLGCGRKSHKGSFLVLAPTGRAGSLGVARGRSKSHRYCLLLLVFLDIGVLILLVHLAPACFNHFLFALSKFNLPRKWWSNSVLAFTLTHVYPISAASPAYSCPQASSGPRVKETTCTTLAVAMVSFMSSTEVMMKTPLIEAKFS